MHLGDGPITWLLINQSISYLENKIINLENEPIKEFFAFLTGVFEPNVAWKTIFITHYWVAPKILIYNLFENNASYCAEKNNRTQLI